MNELTEYADARDKAIVESIQTDSVEPFKAFIREQSEKGFLPQKFSIALPSDEVLEISIRQMAIHCTNIEPEIKGKAVDWLLSHGCDLDYTK